MSHYDSLCMACIRSIYSLYTAGIRLVYGWYTANMRLITAVIRLVYRLHDLSSRTAMKTCFIKRSWDISFDNNLGQIIVLEEPPGNYPG